MKPADRIFNILTMIVLGLTAISCLCIGTVAIAPAGLIPFIGPATQPSVLSVPTTSAVEASPTDPIYPTLPPAWTATITATITETATDVPATATVAATTSGTRTPFPTGVGPTVTLTPTDRPTATNSPLPPTHTSTPGSYPGDLPTGTPPPPSYP